MPLVLQPPLLDLYGNYEYGEQLDEGILNGILLDTRPNMATLMYHNILPYIPTVTLVGNSTHAPHLIDCMIN
jgi:hypothetical protein